jgi:hypothetical protein
VACSVLLGACAANQPPPDTVSPSPTKGSLIAGGGIVRVTAAPTGNLPQCDFPKQIPTPDWLPSDLPFPAGAYTIQELSVDGGFHRSIMVIPGDLVSWTQFVLDQWPKSGYVLGRGDSETGEVEDTFAKLPSVGAFKAISVYCSPGFSKMLFIFSDQSPGLPVLPSPSGSPLNPGASP